MLKEIRDAQLYIEGKQVPLKQASCQQMVNNFTMCHFSIPATPKGLRLRYRSHVLIFVSRPILSEEGVPEYDLLFDGEIVAPGFNYSVSSTACQFTAVGHYHHLSQRLMMLGANSQVAQEDLGTDDLYMGTGMSTYSPLGAINRTFFESSKDGDVDMTKGLQKFLRGVYDNSDAEVELATASKSTNLGEKGVDTFFREVGLSRKLRYDADKERYHIAPSETMNKLLGYRATEATNLLYRQMGSDLSGKMSRWDIIQRLLSLFTYDVTMPLGSIKGSFIAKPNLYFNAPPKCNVILPNKLTGINFSDDYRAKKSRCFSTLQGMPSLLGSKTYNNWTPFEVNQNVRDTYNPEVTEKKLFETDWEKKYGIHAGFTSVYSPYILCATAALSKVQKASDSNKDMYLEMQKLIQEYERMKVFYGTSQLSFTCHYSPSLVAGFPILIIQAFSSVSKETEDSEDYVAFIGYLSSVNHTVIPGTGFGTSGTVSFVRVVNSDIDTLSDPSLNVVDFGLPWLSQAVADLDQEVAETRAKTSNEYLPDKIGKTLYKSALGCDSAYTSTDINKAVASIYNEYFSALVGFNDDRKLDDFIKSNLTTERNFATKAETLAYYKFADEPVPVAPTGNDPVDRLIAAAIKAYGKSQNQKVTTSERRQVVEEYIQSLGYNEDRALFGYDVGRILGKSK